jgi:hypothetical protein
MAGAAEAMAHAILQTETVEVVGRAYRHVPWPFRPYDAIQVAFFLAERLECLAASAWHPEQA